ncbi:hypothetical protein PTSG_03707 [Salpingoeca rosetta]|uniref:Basic leucine zipper domain-containing protein n=1 Tax=Salpingoeca rosetta (strain ATCC 50818 / BSB-021) TaxID=946362 RepID=F2U6C8_SALR5|nr:uncharacterized protein PTSG_03707 [Salpingoeca rosetta]EGD83069.1 hypothetical protein PTSG_03707 [Salpingoeca rosetta]|eukprot:XP_004995433.1 hypothetical protein PTSG_03707 [Salpingoeca rosetta]
MHRVCFAGHSSTHASPFCSVAGEEDDDDDDDNRRSPLNLFDETLHTASSAGSSNSLHSTDAEAFVSFPDSTSAALYSTTKLPPPLPLPLPQQQEQEEHEDLEDDEGLVLNLSPLSNCPAECDATSLPFPDFGNPFKTASQQEARSSSDAAAPTTNVATAPTVEFFDLLAQDQPSPGFFPLPPGTPPPASSSAAAQTTGATARSAVTTNGNGNVTPASAAGTTMTDAVMVGGLQASAQVTQMSVSRAQGMPPGVPATATLDLWNVDFLNEAACSSSPTPPAMLSALAPYMPQDAMVNGAAGNQGVAQASARRSCLAPRRSGQHSMPPALSLAASNYNNYASYSTFTANANPGNNNTNSSSSANPAVSYAYSPSGVPAVLVPMMAPQHSAAALTHAGNMVEGRVASTGTGTITGNSSTYSGSDLKTEEQLSPSPVANMLSEDDEQALDFAMCGDPMLMDTRTTTPPPPANRLRAPMTRGRRRRRSKRQQAAVSQASQPHVMTMMPASISAMASSSMSSAGSAPRRSLRQKQQGQVHKQRSKQSKRHQQQQEEEEEEEQETSPPSSNSSDHGHSSAHHPHKRGVKLESKYQWDEHLLTMPRAEFVHFTRTNKHLTADQLQDLRQTRRRMKNRLYQKDARDRRFIRVARERELTRHQLQASVRRLSARCLRLEAIIRAHCPEQLTTLTEEQL